MSIRSMLVFEEGWERKAYPDPVSRGDPWTIGVGHTGPEVRGGLVWADGQIEAALAVDIETAEAACVEHFTPWFQGLNEARRAVLVGMMFQMGPRRVLKFANTLGAVKDGRYDDAADGMRDSVWGHQTPKRAIRMAEQMQSGVWDPHYTKD